MKIWSLLVLLALSLLATGLLSLTGCSRNDTSAGGGIETTNGGLAVQGRVLWADGSPAIKNLVIARTAWIRGDSLHTHTDSTGLFQLYFPQAGHWIIETTDGSTQGSIQHVLRSQNAETLVLPDVALVGRQTMYGKLMCDSVLCSASLDLPDLGIYDLNVGALFTLNQVPRTPLRLFAHSSNNWQFEGIIHPMQWNDTLIIQLSQNKRILLDDFNEINNTHEATLFPQSNGSWWVNTDSIIGSDLWEPHCLPCIKSDLAWNGSSLYIHNQEVLTGANLRLGLWFKQDPAHHDSSWLDLRALESITFYARGSGQVRMELITKEYYEQGMDRYFGTHFGLSSSWDKINLDQSNFVYEQNDPTWSSVASQTAGVLFVIPPGTEFWLDDLSLIGLGLQDLQ